MRLGRRVGPLAVGGAMALAGLLVAGVDPSDPGRYPLCPFRWATGLDCPGCGTLRAIHALTHGDVGAALDHNVVTVLLLPVLGTAWVLWLRGARKGRAVPSLPPWAGYATAAVLATFWVARNLPWAPFEVLASGIA